MDQHEKGDNVMTLVYNVLFFVVVVLIIFYDISVFSLLFL